MCVHKWQSNNVQYELPSPENIKLECTEKEEKKEKANTIQSKTEI
jgi:hypothetical protein